MVEDIGTDEKYFPDHYVFVSPIWVFGFRNYTRRSYTSWPGDTDDNWTAAKAKEVTAEIFREVKRDDDRTAQRRERERVREIE